MVVISCYIRSNIQTINVKATMTFQKILFLFITVINIGGWLMAYSPAFDDKLKANPEIQPLRKLMKWNSWLHLYWIPLMVLLFFCFSCVVMVATATGRTRNINLERIAQNVPIIGQFLDKKAQKYDKETHYLEECVICLNRFEDDENLLVAELDCSSKHVFHVECMKQWTKNNDICPICREPIVKS